MKKTTKKTKTKPMTYPEELANAVYAKVKKYHGRRVTTELLSYVIADAIRAVKEVDAELEYRQAIKEAKAAVTALKKRKVPKRKDKPLVYWDVFRAAK